MSKAARTAARGWVTRTTRILESLIVDETNIDFVQLEDVISQFDSRMNSLDEVQNDYELTIESEETIIAEIEDAGEFRDKARKPRIIAGRLLKNHLKKDD